MTICLLCLIFQRKVPATSMQGHLLLFRKPELLTTATSAAAATTATAATKTATTATTATTEPTAPNKATKTSKTTKTETNQTRIFHIWLLILFPKNRLAYLKIVNIQHLQLILKLIHLYNLHIFINKVMLST